MAPRLVVPADNPGLRRDSRCRASWGSPASAADAAATGTRPRGWRRENPAVGRPAGLADHRRGVRAQGALAGAAGVRAGRGGDEPARFAAAVLAGLRASWRCTRAFTTSRFPRWRCAARPGLRHRHRPGAHDHQQLRRHPVQGASGCWAPSGSSPSSAGASCASTPQPLLIDATPSCDAYRVRTACASCQPLGDYCADAQRGTANDELANFGFPKQDPSSASASSAARS